jgi:hypothetical protein
VFNASISSALQNLIDIDLIYIISSGNGLYTKYQDYFGDRVIFINESIFPYNAEIVQEVMIQAVVNENSSYQYVNGNTPFENLITGERKLW